MVFLTTVHHDTFLNTVILLLKSKDEYYSSIDHFQVKTSQLFLKTLILEIFFYRKLNKSFNEPHLPDLNDNYFFAQSTGAVEYTDCTSAEGVRPPPPTSVLDMTLNNLMVRFQQCWSFGECGVLLHCHRSQVHSGPEW